MSQSKICDLEDKVFELDKQLEAKRQETQELANIASVITSILDIQSVLAASMEIGIRQVSAEVGAVLLVEGGTAVVKVSWGVDGAFLKSLAYRDNLDIAAYCLAHRKTIYENDCSGLFPGHDAIRNFIAGPILSKERAIGAMVIFNKMSGDGFTGDDVLQLDLICKFTAVAIENANLLLESLEKQRMEQELELARQVQATFLPGDVAIDGLKIAASYIPARQVGGDYYDLIPISETGLFFLIGDVSSKGAPAALVMTSVYSIVRAYVTSGKPINVPALMSQLNEILCSDVIKSRGMFITLFMACLDLESGSLEYCNGGHPPPYYHRAATGEVVPLKRGGPLVGQLPGVSYVSTQINIGRNDRIFCFTDGLVEAANADGELFGLNRVKGLFCRGAELDTEHFSRAVKEEMDNFRRGGSVDSIDDFTTLVIDILDMPEAARRHTFVYPSSLDSLEKLYADLDGVISRYGLPDEAVHRLEVAVSEAVTNAIIHAHGEDSSKKIQFSVEVNDESIIAEIIDGGTGLAATAGEEFDPAGSPDAESGRGLGLIKRLSDEVTFTRLPEGGTAVKIIKYLAHNVPDGGTHGHHRE